MLDQRYVVLVVEDDEEMNALEREFLEVHGVDTVAAYSGTQAIDACDGRAVDAVLLDVMLPEKDGFETCRQIRQRAGPALPIVMLTALDAEDYCRRGLEVGADAYFTKPFDPAAVIEKIFELLRRNGRGLQAGGGGEGPGLD